MEAIKKEVARQCKSGKALLKLQRLATLTNNDEVANACSDVYSDRYKCTIKYVAQVDTLITKEELTGLKNPGKNEQNG